MRGDVIETSALVVAIVGMGLWNIARTDSLMSRMEAQVESLRGDIRSVRGSVDALSARMDDLYKLMLERLQWPTQIN